MSFSLKKVLEKDKADFQQKLQEKIPSYEKNYGFKQTTQSEKSLETVKKIVRAEEELMRCQNCVGAPCKKEADKYSVPQVEGWDFKGSIPLVPCKWAAMATAEIAKNRFAESNIPLKYADKTFADYEITDDNERAIRLAKWFITKKPAKSLYLYGGAGTGKTFLATLIAKEFCNVIFGDVPTLLGKIKQTFNGNGDSQEIISRYCNCDLLILDDLGAGQVTEWSADIIYQIINNRYNALKPIVITSNFDIEGLQERLKIDSYSATRITSRLSEMCLQGFLGTKDRRR